VYFQNYNPPQTHLAPAETNPAFGAYELRGVGSDESGEGALETAAHFFNRFTSVLFAYYGYKKNKSFSDAAMWGIGAFFVQMPIYLVMKVGGEAVGGENVGTAATMVFPAVAAYYAFGKKD